MSWAAFTLAAPKVLAGIEPLTAMAYATCTGAVLLALVAAPDLGRVPWGGLPSQVWLNVAYLAIGATAVANVLYYRGVAAVGPASASLMMFLVPAVNTACATLFLDESFTAPQAVGAVVLLIGAALAGRARISLRQTWRRSCGTRGGTRTRTRTRTETHPPAAGPTPRRKLTPRPPLAGYPKDHE